MLLTLLYLASCAGGPATRSEPAPISPKSQKESPEETPSAGGKPLISEDPGALPGPDNKAACLHGREATRGLRPTRRPAEMRFDEDNDAAADTKLNPTLESNPTATTPAFDPKTCPQAKEAAALRQRCARLPELATRCKADQAGACGQLGDCALSDRENGLQRAIALYRHACKLKDGHSCWRLGLLLLRGQGLPRDRPAAWRHMRQACELKDAQGCASAGLLRYLGSGVEKNEDDAATFFEIGCRAESGNACLQLGILYARGDTQALIPKSRERALSLYRRACRLCEPKACHLAAHYLRARPDSLDEAQRLRDKAAALGYRADCYPREHTSPPQTSLDKRP